MSRIEDERETGYWEDRTHIILIVNHVWFRHTRKLPHYALEPGVAFWHDYISPA